MRVGILLAMLCCIVTLSGCGSANSSPIVSSTPQNGSTNAVIGHEPIKVTMAKDLDPSTVNGATVTLRGQDTLTGRPAVTTGIVGYDSRKRTITFAPTWGFSNNRCSYALKLAGLKDTNGEIVPETTISFTTAKIVQQLSGIGLDVNNGNPPGRFYRTLSDKDGNPTRYIQYSGAGSDGTWFTDDEQIDYYLSYTTDSANKTWRWVNHTSPGPDGAWFTADDPINGYRVYTWSNGKDITVNYSGAGGDGSWFTADDTVSGYQVTSYNADGSMSSIISYSNSGPDGKWFTADDTYSSYSTYLYDANGNLTRQATSSGAGADGIPFTADDQAGSFAGTTTSVSTYPSYGVSYQTTTYDANNRPLSWASYQDPGPDGVWFTPDDVYTSYTTSLYDAEGKLTRRASSPGAGADGIPFTADDSSAFLATTGSTVSPSPSTGAVSYESYSYDGEGNLICTVSYGDPGPDGIWFTADDKVSNYMAYSLNAAGKLIRRSDYYGGPGPDGVWFTADDPVYGYFDCSYDASGNLVRTAYFYIGPDGVPFTADDQPAYYYVDTYDAGRFWASTTFGGAGPDGKWFTADDSLRSRNEYAFFP